MHRSSPRRRSASQPLQVSDLTVRAPCLYSSGVASLSGIVLTTAFNTKQLQMRTTRRAASAMPIMTGNGTQAKKKFEQRAATMMAAKAIGSVPGEYFILKSGSGVFSKGVPHHTVVSVKVKMILA